MDPRENVQPMNGAEELGGKLLEGVSRSFYLTLKALPQGLREPLSLAYLLARAADTMADTIQVPDAVRLTCLAEFERRVRLPLRDPIAEGVLVARLLVDFVPHQEDAHEARLLERLQEALDAFHASPEGQKSAMVGVLGPIIQGQMLDIQRFPGDGKLRALATTRDLDDYTYLVAGCVGEFWTRLCATEAEGSFNDGVSLDEMVARGIRYGKGLQLVNILRDPGKDLKLGRCYIPEEALQTAGLSVADVQTDPAKLMPLLTPWKKLCREHLHEGIRYLDEVKNRRLLYATALPLLLGIKTLALIETADWSALETGVKVSRAEVSKVLLEAGVAVLRKGGMRKLAERYFGGR